MVMGEGGDSLDHQLINMMKVSNLLGGVHTGKVLNNPPSWVRGQPASEIKHLANEKAWDTEGGKRKRGGKGRSTWWSMMVRHRPSFLPFSNSFAMPRTSSIV